MDRDQPTDEKAAAPGNGRAGVMMSRRRFTRAGLSGSVVLGSLVSKPVLGAGPQCTVSGQASGNLSRADPGNDCAVGFSPEFWLAQEEWPYPFVKGTLPDDKCAYTGKKLEGTVFNGFGYSDSELLTSAFSIEPTDDGASGVCAIVSSTAAAPNSNVSSFTVNSSSTNDAKTTPRCCRY